MPMILSPRYYVLQLSNGELREVYRREHDGRLMIAYVTSPNESKGFTSILDIYAFYKRHFDLDVVDMLSE